MDTDFASLERELRGDPWDDPRPVAEEPDPYAELAERYADLHDGETR